MARVWAMRSGTDQARTTTSPASRTARATPIGERTAEARPLRNRRVKWNLIASPDPGRVMTRRRKRNMTVMTGANQAGPPRRPRRSPTAMHSVRHARATRTYDGHRNPAGAPEARLAMMAHRAPVAMTAAPDSRWAISRGVIHGAAPLRAPRAAPARHRRRTSQAPTPPIRGPMKSNGAEMWAEPSGQMPLQVWMSLTMRATSAAAASGDRRTRSERRISMRRMPVIVVLSPGPSCIRAQGGCLRGRRGVPAPPVP